MYVVIVVVASLTYILGYRAGRKKTIKALLSSIEELNAKMNYVNGQIFGVGVKHQLEDLPSLYEGPKITEELAVERAHWYHMGKVYGKGMEKGRGGE